MNLPTLTFTENIGGSLTVTGSGGVSVGGSATYSPSSAVVGSGGVSVGGSATVVITTALQLNFVGSGGVSVGGGADISSALVNIYDLSKDGVPSGGMVMGGSAAVSDAIQLVPTGGMAMSGSAAVSEKILYVPVGGMLMSGAADAALVTVHTPAGGMLMSGTSQVAEVRVVAPAGGMVMGGSASALFNAGIAPVGGMQMGGIAVVIFNAGIAPVGGMQMGGSALAYMVPSYITPTTENPYGDPFPGWAVNLETNAPSRYLNLAANSITRFKGRSFVSNAGGIYEMGADDDAGHPIHASVEFATNDFGNSYEKRMEKTYIGVRTTGQLNLKVMVKGVKPMYYVLADALDTPKGKLVPIGKGLVGRYWGARLDNVNGADFELDSIEFNPVRGQRHGA